MLRKEGFNAIIDFLNNNQENFENGEEEVFWSEIANLASNQTEQLKVIIAMPEQNDEWALSILDFFSSEGKTDRVIDQAERAKRKLLIRLKR